MIPTKNTKRATRFLQHLTGLCFSIVLLVVSGCSKDDVAPASMSISPPIKQLNFSPTMHGEKSTSKNITLKYAHLSDAIIITASSNFEVSIDDTNFHQSLSLSKAELPANSIKIYVRFSPELNLIETAIGTLTISSKTTESITLKLEGISTPKTYNYTTFKNKRLAFGNGHNQSAIDQFTLHEDLTEIKTIKMFVQLTCPDGGCDQWDVYAHVLIKEQSSGDWYELGRFITPYWNDNSQLERGFEFDVTDFKSLLNKKVELKIFTECWNPKGYNVSVDFDYIKGTPDYSYSSITKVLQYNKNSISGVPYGKKHTLDLTKSISIPSNAKATSLRTIISGWGHAKPYDEGNRGCAEWCFRTHYIKINNQKTFKHYMGPIGCGSNPVNNQNPGNWKGERAGWCPGMEVPTRIDILENAMAGSTFDFEYDFKYWRNNDQNGEAYNAISTYIIVKSNTPIDKATVTN